MTPKELGEFREGGDTDWAYEITGVARFRCNAGRDRFGPMAVFRVIPNKIRTADEMGLSREVQNLCYLTKGLVVVTGPTGSGKSTTLAGLVDLINRTRTDHIITIEDPIEFVHPSKKCLVTQRQVGLHTRSFKHALRAALREDPDIILVGEMRDLETVSIAIETAETGHLVFGTLHTTTASSTIDRIIDQFPPDRQSQVRVMLSESLRGVIAQTLCKKIGGGRVAAREILLLHSGRLQPDSGRKDVPDPFHHADQPQDRDGHSERRAPGAGGRQAGRAQGGVHEGGREDRVRRRVEGQKTRRFVSGRGMILGGQSDGRTGGQEEEAEETSSDPTACPPVHPPILVLVNPQDIVNIASSVRIAKNFGIERLRLVKPEVFDPYRIEGIAHNTADFVAKIEILDTLEEAIADCVFTAVLTARERAAKRRVLRPARGGCRDGAGRRRPVRSLSWRDGRTAA